ncbi:hypothetical protein Ade02nite_02270 [Paractinoplanes deccanensis]|uniref:Multicopper oxidase family protein n=1 Tax=Paractinoplanes deccanensis TaxID=113561 RepID=A0ABQ3XV20_9ACTN|nr:hypothetical protein Ade02nite_02270 [Actinoplanes deccanensis]
MACLGAAAILGPLGWHAYASRLPSAYAVTDMGYEDHGGHDMAMPTAGTRSVTTLIADPDRPADVRVTLTARKEKDRYTLNGQTPGPAIHATVGQLVQVRLVNENVPDGITLHWHGVDVPNAEDGVAGVTQDAVGAGREHTYRFVADQAGTFWYHSHQISAEQVRQGLLGALVVATAAPVAGVTDVVALTHNYDGTATVNGRPGETHVDAPPARRFRLRVVNTDNGEVSVRVAGAPFRLIAIDGTDVSGPALVANVSVPVTAGGRADLDVTTPADGSAVRVSLSGAASLVLGPAGAPAPPPARPATRLDPLTYGSNRPLGFDPARPDRQFRYDIGRRPGFLDGRPGLFWTVNGHLYPDVPMFMVTEGDVVRMRIANHSGESHPMHLHGHHAVVLSRNGVPATGSPWWVDSLEVADGDTYDIAFVADNPGLWMDHCHNLPHAAEGLVAHLMYEGVTTPFSVGGTAGNEPE